MKINLNSIEDVKEKIKALKGQNVNLSINKGRKNFYEVACTIGEVYSSVFTISLDSGNKTYSYTDVLCGNVKIL